MIITCALSPFTSPSSSAELAKLQSKLAALKKVEELCEFYEQNKNTLNDPTKLLDNLCDGLETFLGFDSTSKGYDGTGIVYSDLDRLCDGVMGFLLSCLEGSKELLTHYNDQIPSIIEELKSSIGKGLGVSGFASAIGKVKDGLQGYEGEMGSRFAEVTEPLTTMQKGFQNLETYLSNASNKNLKTQLDHVAEQAGAYWSNAAATSGNATELDANLQRNVRIPVDLIVQAAQNFKDLAEHPDVTEQAGVVDRELEERERHIKHRIQEEAKMLQGKLTAQFETIRQGVNSINEQKNAQFKMVTGTAAAAQAEIRALLEKFCDVYRLPIIKHFVDIKKVLNDLDKDKNSKGKAWYHSQLYDEVDEIKKCLGASAIKLQGYICDLQKWADDTKNFIDSIAHDHIDDIIDGKVGNDIKDTINKTASDVETETLKLHGQFNAKKKELQRAVEAITSASRQLEDPTTLKQKMQLPEDLSGFQGDGWDLKEKISGITTEITNNVNHYVKKIGTALLEGWGAADISQRSGDFTRGVEKLGEALTRAGGESNLGEIVTRFARSKAANVRLLETGLYYFRQASGMSLTSELQDSNPYLKALQSAFSNVATDNVNEPKLRELLVAAVNKSIDNFQSKIKDDVVTGILGNISKNVDGFANEATAAERALRNHAVTVRAKLADLMNAFANAGKGIKKVLQLLKDDCVDNRLFAGIRGNILNLESNTIQKANNVMDSIHKRVLRLETVPGRVEDAQVVAAKLMGDLENDIESVERSINTIGTKLKTAQVALARTIDATYRVLSAAERTSCQAIDTFQKSLTETVNITFRQIEKDVRSLFAKQKQAELTALEGVVTAQLAEIDRIIREDREKGVKGFLSKLKGDVDASGSAASSNKLDALRIVLGHANQTPEESVKKFAPLATLFKTYVDNVLQYIEGQVTTIKVIEMSSQGRMLERNKQSNHVSKVKSKLYQLLDHFINNENKMHNYDSTFSNYLRELVDAVSAFRADAFGEGRHPELLNLLKEAMTQFDKHLNYAYVSTYSKQRWVYDDSSKYAKVCLTTLPILYTELKELTEEIEKTGDNWRFYSMYNSSQPDACLYGVFFRHNGYDHDLPIDAECGELNHKMTFNGGHIVNHLKNKEHNLFSPTLSRLAGASGSHSKSDEITLEVVSEDGLIPKLYAALEPYNKVGHLATASATKSPCSVFEQLVWLGGLQFNSVYDSLMEHVEKLFLVDNENNPPEKISKPIEAYPRTLRPNNITSAIEHASSHAYMVLTAVVGTGDEFTYYASDMCNNSMKFHYPASGEDCLDMLLDILRRLLPTLSFLKRQCTLSTKHGGWRNCNYGKDVLSSKLLCTDHSTEKVTSQPNCKANCQPTCQANCGPTSPLMSYLNDCLPGHLPHALTEIGCKPKCSTCPSRARGMPCLPPLGFRGFSGSTKTGKNLCDVLEQFLGDRYLPGVFCLTPKPPSTLPEHFGFALSLAKGISIKADGYSVVADSLQNAFEASVKKQSVQLYEEPSHLMQTLMDAYGAEYAEHKACKDSHVRNLTTSDSCKGKTKTELECAPYLSTLCYQSYRYLAMKHSNVYLSWAVYLPWDFWSYLKGLYDAFCNIHCQDWGCRGCLRADKCKTGSHGSTNETTNMSNCQCHSIVECKGVSPTLYQCGFSFQNPSSLNHDDYPNKCSDFCTQLGYVLKSEYFKNLFKECDKFLFTIRQPFIWLNVALWLLSLLYLIHIMVIRLDLLHIKSHLHSPSSHRIAAQSLLAAARVNKLNRVFYLQP